MEWRNGAPLLAMSDSQAALAAVSGRRGGRRAAELGVGVHARTAEQHREDGRRGGEVGGARTAEVGHIAALSKRGNEAKAARDGLEGDEKCPGCDGEQCGVHKVGLGKGSNGQQGRMIGEEWYCDRHGQRLYRRLRRAGGRAG